MSSPDSSKTESAATVSSEKNAAAFVPSILRRVATIPYEGLLLLALLLIASFPIAGLKGYTLDGIPHLIYQLYLLLITAGYFGWLWTHGGQTLPMKTWRFKVVNRNGNPLTVAEALKRFAIAMLFFGPAAAGLVLLFFPARMNLAITMWMFLPMVATIWWAKFDHERQFLHDHLSGTMLVNALAETMAKQ